VEEEKISIARFQQPKKLAVDRQWLCKHVSTAAESQERNNRGNM
jgi:hypothetical protein